MHTARKFSFIISLLAVSFALLWYAVCTNRIAATDFAFIDKHSSTDMFASALYFDGIQSYYANLDPAAAAEYFRRSITRDPLYIPSWVNLAKVELAEGRQKDAERIVDILEPLIEHVSTWKWQELLLAYDLRNDKLFDRSLNFILNRLPYRIPEAHYLAVKYFGDAVAVVPHIAPDNRTTYLNQLMRAKETDAALAIWQQLRASESPIDRDLELRFCQFLLADNRLEAAESVWQSWAGETQTQATVYDGSFQEEPLNMAFGWRFARNPQVSVDRTTVTSYQGTHSLHLHFRGADNVNFYHVSQLVPVQPGKEYLLSFACRSRNLTTDQGVFVEVLGYRCKGLYAASEPITGSSAWVVQEVRFSPPAGCQAATIRIRRKESLMFDNKISGDYWLDDVKLQELDG